MEREDDSAAHDRRELAPDAGTIEQADGLRAVYFDQNRESLDASLTLRRALSPEGDARSPRSRKISVSLRAARYFCVEIVRRREARVILARLIVKAADLPGARRADQ
jgi:ATP-binding cassette subfamily F protein uup